MKLYLGLVHYPIKNKRDETVTTSVTNMDIHDISRSCRTFGVVEYHIITPLEAQHGLIQRILGHWEQDKNGAYNPDRQEALSIARLSHSLEESIKVIKEKEGIRPLVCATGANFEQYELSPEQVKEKAHIDKAPIFLIFGTGWGLHAQALELADHLVEPIFGASLDGYNHLSVRSAVAIYLDRFNRS
ncbi:MAG: RNA methyltransferase [Bacteriovoracaceae bacterium]|nr:RNA methyltransferase [Bacteriovoracaceae bacterium]